MPKKRALITGISGMDGSYLAELLLEKNYDVWGSLRRSSSFNTGRINHIFDRLTLRYADLTDAASIENLLLEAKPDEIYNLGAQSHVLVSFSIPEYTADATAIGVLHMLNAMKAHCPDARFYQASSSEMFGSAAPPQNELTTFHPRSPYGVAKVYAHNLAVNYRESYGMHISCGILFNHESKRRGDTFVTKKIVNGVVAIYRGEQNVLTLGNLEARRDWGYAPEYVEGMFRMLQQDKPDDYVLATGETHTVREFCQEAFRCLGMNYLDYVEIDPKYYRPAEVDVLQGDASKAKRVLGWEPEVKFSELVKIMVEAELHGKEKITLDIRSGLV
jgi:GDPmannose 4,6-dehydratase